MANRTFADYAASLSSGTLDSVIGLDGSTVKTAVSGILSVENKDDDFTADGASGTVYTNGGAAGNISVALEDSPIGTQYTFSAVQAGTIEVTPFAGNTIKFYDYVAQATVTVPGDGAFIENGNFGSFTILKLTATVWTVTAGYAEANG